MGSVSESVVRHAPGLLTVRVHPGLQRLSEDEQRQSQEGCRPGGKEHAPANRKPHRRNRPDAGRGGQALDDLSAKDDRAGADEAYAAGYLRSHPGGIEDDVLLVEDVGEPEDGDHHEKG